MRQTAGRSEGRGALIPALVIKLTIELESDYRQTEPFQMGLMSNCALTALTAPPNTPDSS